MTLHQPNLFGINVGTNTVFSLQTVAIPSSGNPYTVAPVLHNHIRLLFSSTRSLFVLLFHFKLIQSEAIQELRSATVFSWLFYSSIAEFYFALSISPRYFSKVNIDNVKIGGVIYYSKTSI